MLYCFTVQNVDADVLGASCVDTVQCVVGGDPIAQTDCLVVVNFRCVGKPSRSCAVPLPLTC